MHDIDKQYVLMVTFSNVNFDENVDRSSSKDIKMKIMRGIPCESRVVNLNNSRGFHYEFPRELWKLRGFLR